MLENGSEEGLLLVRAEPLGLAKYVLLRLGLLMTFVVLAVSACGGAGGGGGGE